MTNILKKIITLYAVLMMSLFAPVAMGHGKGVPINEDKCTQALGTNYVHFSAYQPQFVEKAHYCRDIPQTGETIIVIDLVDKVLRSIPVTLRIVDGSGANTTNEVIVDIPSRIYANGVVETKVNFLHPGKYTAIVSLVGDEEHLTEVYINVAQAKNEVSMSKILATLLVLLVLFMIARAVIKSRKPA